MFAHLKLFAENYLICAFFIGPEVLYLATSNINMLECVCAYLPDFEVEILKSQVPKSNMITGYMCGIISQEELAYFKDRYLFLPRATVNEFATVDSLCVQAQYLIARNLQVKSNIYKMQAAIHIYLIYQNQNSIKCAPSSLIEINNKKIIPFLIFGLDCCEVHSSCAFILQADTYQKIRTLVSYEEELRRGSRK